MSFSDILNKLAEKKAIQGNSDFAYRLISVAEKMEEEKKEEETKAEMIKRGKDKKASTLEQMIHKYAGKEGKGSFKDKIKEMDGFLRMDGKAFCFQNNAQAKKALGVAEQAANFLNWQVMKGDGCFKLMEMGRDKKAITLEKMIHKYAFDLYERGMSEQNEPDDEKIFEKLRKNPNLFKESSLKDLIKKYAKEDWEISSEEAYEPFVNTDVDPLQFDDIYDAMGKGFEDGKRDPETNKNPYDPVKHDDSLVKAYNDGFETAASDFMGRGSY